MNRKKSISIATSILAILLTISCESHEQQADRLVRNYKHNMKDMKIDPIMKVKQVKTMKEAEQASQKKTVLLDDWAVFKIEIEQKIISNELKIKEIKGLPSTGTKLFKKITQIEKKNLELRNQLKTYEEDLKFKKEEFKLKMNAETEEINVTLTDLKPIEKK